MGISVHRECGVAPRGNWFVPAALALGWVILAWPAAGRAQTTFVGGGKPLAKTAKIDSYISTSDAKRLWDEDPGKVDATNFPALLNQFPGPTVDVLMAQCFSGGFAAGMDSAIKQYTFTAASNWNELAYSTPTVMDNFTSSWVQSFPRAEGLYTHYVDTVKGAPAIVGPPARGAVTADPFGPGGKARTAKFFENPVFASPDALANGKPDPTGANNSRDVVSGTWALLMAPNNQTSGVDTPRFQTDIDRVYDSLIGIGVPANQIIVLYGSKLPNTKTNGGTPINGPATYANIANAAISGKGLYGNIKGQTAPAGPGATSNLFVYNTGHGRSWDETGSIGRVTKPVNPLMAGASAYDVSVNDMPANQFLDADGSTSLTGNVDLQLYSQRADLVGTAISVNGIRVGQLNVDPLPECDLTGMIGTSNAYDVSVPLTLFDSLGTPGLPVDIKLGTGDGSVGALPDAAASDSLVQAVTFGDYGQDWSVGVSVPEPGSMAIILIFGVPLLARRKRRSEA